MFKAFPSDKNFGFKHKRSILCRLTYIINLNIHYIDTFIVEDTRLIKKKGILAGYRRDIKEKVSWQDIQGISKKSYPCWISKGFQRKVIRAGYQRDIEGISKKSYPIAGYPRNIEEKLS